MAIPTRMAGPKAPLKQMGQGADQQRGYAKKDMPEPEHVRRHKRLVENIQPNSYVPDSVRK